MIEISPYEWVKRVLDGKVKGIKAVPASHASFRRVTFNVASPPFDNKKLREAAAHAIMKLHPLAELEGIEFTVPVGPPLPQDAGSFGVY